MPLSFLVSCLLIVAVTEGGVLKCQTVLVHFPVFPFRVIGSCFMSVGVVQLGAPLESES